MEGYIPIKRFYTVLGIVSAVIGILAYTAGDIQGNTDCKLEAANVTVINQRKVYTNDLKIDKDTPHPSSRDFGDWMRDQIPVFDN